MKVEILFKDRTTFQIDRVFKITTVFENDCLYVYRRGYEPGIPTYKFHMSNIVCVEVIEC